MQVRQKLSNYFDKFNSYIPGEILGFISMIVALTGIIISFINFPTYSIFISMVSHLGMPGMTSVYFLFDSCLMISGLINIPFALAFGRFIRQKIGENKWIKIAILWNCISSISLILVGFFLINSIILSDFFYALHVLCAIVMFSGVVIYCIIYSNLIIKHKDKFTNSLAILGYIAAGMQMAFLFSWKSYLEWFSIFLIMAWNIIMSAYMLNKKYQIK